MVAACCCGPLPESVSPGAPNIAEFVAVGAIAGWLGYKLGHARGRRSGSLEGAASGFLFVGHVTGLLELERQFRPTARNDRPPKDMDPVDRELERSRW